MKNELIKRKILQYELELAISKDFNYAPKTKHLRIKYQYHKLLLYLFSLKLRKARQ